MKERKARAIPAHAGDLDRLKKLSHPADPHTERFHCGHSGGLRSSQGYLENPEAWQMNWNERIRAKVIVQMTVPASCAALVNCGVALFLMRRAISASSAVLRSSPPAMVMVN